jgi:phosphoribosylformimino-5-aminoimidazole carboxamide ribotide isomerase
VDIILAIDLIDAKAVRLHKGDYATKKVYFSDPLEVAKEYEDWGFKRLHVVDLDGAKAKEPRNLQTVEKIANQTNLIIDLGGGLHTKDNFDSAFSAGVELVTVGSLAANNQELAMKLLEIYSARKLILGADCKNEKIAVSGWTEVTNLSVYQFINSYLEEGYRSVISTDISQDGTLEGPSFDLYEKIYQSVGSKKINLIASGGVSSIDDLKRLKAMGLSGAIVGKAFYEGKVTFKELAEV